MLNYDFIYFKIISMKKKSLFFSIGMFLVSGLLVTSNFHASSNSSFSSENLETSKNNLETLGTNNVSILSTYDDDEVSPLTVTLQSYNKTTVSHSFQFKVGLNSTYTGNKNFYIGYYEGEKAYPASLEYDVYDKDGYFVTTAKTNIIQKSNHGVGDYLGATSFTSYCDIELPYDLSIDVSSVRLVDVYEAIIIKSEDGTLQSRDPDLDNPWEFETSEAKSYYTTDMSDFLDCSFSTFANYDKYLSVTFNVENYIEKIYPELTTTTASLYAKNKDKINSGAYSLRTRLSFGGDSSIRVTSKTNNNAIIDIKDTELTTGDLKYFGKTGSSTLLLNLENEKLKAANINSKDDILDIKLIGCTVSVEILNNDTSKVLARSTETRRFGVISLKMQDILNNDGSIAIKKVDTTLNKNYTSLFIWSIAGFFVVYCALAVCYYFYLKNKDKNSEFKVLNNKQFIKVNILGVICLESILIDVLYIIARSNLFNNSLKVYNPLDWVICLASVVAICLIGYFVKYYWNSFKSYREKKARERLHLNANSEDDGTN